MVHDWDQFDLGVTVFVGVRSISWIETCSQTVSEKEGF